MTSGETAAVAFMLNGKKFHYPSMLTITQLLAEKSLKAQMVVVEVNGAIVARASFDEVVLRTGDDVEIVHFVGGGE